jgi:hypothetical protein
VGTVGTPRNGFAQLHCTLHSIDRMSRALLAVAPQLRTDHRQSRRRVSLPENRGGGGTDQPAQRKARQDSQAAMDQALRTSLSPQDYRAFRKAPGA